MVRSLIRFVSEAWRQDERWPAINYTKCYFKMMFACPGLAYVAGIAAAMFLWQFPQSYTAFSNVVANFFKNYEVWAALIVFGVIFIILTPFLYVGEVVYNRYVTPVVTKYQWNEYSWLKSMVVIPVFAVIHVVIILLVLGATRLFS